MNRDPRVGVLKPGEETPLLRVHLLALLLSDSTDVVSCANPVARRDKLFGGSLVVQARTILDTDVAKRVVPVVPVDEKYGSVRHKKTPACGANQTPGGLRGSPREAARTTITTFRAVSIPVVVARRWREL